MKISIVVPCFNEMSNLEILCQRIKRSLEKNNIIFEVILIDDGSQDETWETIKRVLVHHVNFVGIKNAKNVGIYESWKIGIARSTGDLICLIDADLQNQPEDIVRLYNKFHLENSHLIQATRSSIEWHKDLRFYSSRTLNHILNLIFRDTATDNKSGFILAPKHVLVETLNFKRKYHFGVFLMF